jgi:predicted ATPase/DNA-binding XRE family transcriptional regulator
VLTLEVDLMLDADANSSLSTRWQSSKTEQRAAGFGQLLRELRVVAGLTQEELAERSGLSPRGISDLERGARLSPRLVTVRQLSAALQLVDSDRAALEKAAYRPRVPLAREPAVPAGRSSLPVQMTSFVGRDREQSEIERLLHGQRLITLCGPGGIGKTRLALAVAEQAVPQYADRAIFVEFGAASDAVLVPRELASAVGIREDAGQPLLETLLRALANVRMLLVLDNCEHLLSACSDLARRLLDACPRIRILVTSREPLGVADEMVWTVPPLAVGEEQPMSVERLAQLGAVGLFVERARSVWPTFELSPHNAQAVVRVCRRLEGIPLAIELAAARIRVLSVEQIDARLEDRYRLLVWGAAGAPARHQTLLAAVDWSYALLSNAERLLFDRFSVFQGGARLEAVEVVCTPDSLQPAEVADLLQSLVDKSLILAEPEPDGTVRFCELETLKEYGRARVRERNEADALRARHLGYHLCLAEEAVSQLLGPHQLTWLERLDYEHDNMRASLAWSLHCEAALEDGLRLAGALWRFWEVRGHGVEGRRWLASLLGGVGPVAPGVRALALDAAGCLATTQADYADGWRLTQAALALWRQNSDWRGAGIALNHLGIIASARGDVEQACALYQESVAASLATDDRQTTVLALSNLGLNARNRGEYDEARGFIERAMQIHRELGDRRGEGLMAQALGNVAADRGDLSEAAAHFRQALALADEIRDWGIVARSLEGLASILARRNRQLERAARLYGAAQALREEIGMPVAGSGQPEHDSQVEFLESLLGHRALLAAWQFGRTLSRERAVKLALGD